MTGRAILILSLAALASAAGLRVTDPLLALISAEYRVTPGAASNVITAFAVAYGLLQVVHGPVGDRFGKYHVVTAATALSALGTFACAAAPSLGWLVAARFVSGATVGALIPVSMAWIGDVVPYERRQPVIARFLIGQITGIAAGTTVGGVLGEAYGWRTVFVVLGVLYIAIALLLWLELRGNPLARDRGAAAPPSARDAFGSLPRLLRRSWVRVLLATVFVEALIFYGAFAFVALYLHTRLGASLALSGVLVIAYALGAMLYAGLAGHVVARLGERGMVTIGGALLGLAYAGMCFVPSALLAVPCLLAAGAGLYMLHNTLQVNATQMAPEARGAAVSLFALSLFTGQSAGVWLSGRIVDAWGVRPVFAFAALGLPLLAIEFRRRLARHVATGDNGGHAAAKP
jgi:predicted MFS family arabinose efflux permease